MTVTRLSAAIAAVMMVATSAMSAPATHLSDYDARAIIETIAYSCNISTDKNMCAVTYDLEKILRRNGWCYKNDGAWRHCH